MSRAAIGSFVDVPAGRIHVREDGPADAPVLVLVHGFASSLHWYDAVVPLLSEDHRLVRVDLLGCGSSSRDGGRFDHETQTSMVLSVLDTLGVGDFVTVGHSFGSDIAIGLAERSGRARGVVVVGQAPDYATATFPPGHRLGANVLVARSLQALSRLSPPSHGGLGFAKGFRPDRAFADPAQAGTDLRAADPRTFRAVLVERARAMADRPLDQRLGDVGLPALAILGGRDQFYPLAPTRARWDAVPNVRVEVIAESGHSPTVEAPDRFVALLRDFLSAQPSRSETSGES
ncbi:alpha/beta fold hydrolase [Nocardioides stalactiti]|uniref:alpha/beta fold hydrolase n=1 Tax=Nocardioides stalactiti TaxID=2755356 RepID=UPI001601892B|nr:alpha/beta hydrolase [Nocardioides stalactiti]